VKSLNSYLPDLLCMGQDDLRKLLQVSLRKGIFQYKVTCFCYYLLREMKLNVVSVSLVDVCAMELNLKDYTRTYEINETC
jgi:hypothetical protein